MPSRASSGAHAATGAARARNARTVHVLADWIARQQQLPGRKVCVLRVDKRTFTAARDVGKKGGFAAVVGPNRK